MTVTQITCHQSQITGESTCALGCVHSKREANDPQHIVNSDHDLARPTLCGPDLQMIPLKKSDFWSKRKAARYGKKCKILLKSALENKDQRAARDARSSSR